MELKSDVDGDKIIEKVNISLFDIPVEYSLRHCIAKNIRMRLRTSSYIVSH